MKRYMVFRINSPAIEGVEYIHTYVGEKPSVQKIIDTHGPGEYRMIERAIDQYTPSTWKRILWWVGVIITMIIIVVLFSACNYDDTGLIREKLYEVNTVGKRISIIGDSVAAGFDITLSSNYNPANVQANYSKPGSSARNWISNTAEYNQRIASAISFNPDIICVFIGGNDFMDLAADGNISDDDISLVVSRIDKLILILKQYAPGVQICVMQWFDPFDGYSTNLPIEYTSFHDWSDAVIKANLSLAQVCKNRSVTTRSLYGVMNHHGYGRLLGDMDWLDPFYYRYPEYDIHPILPGRIAMAQWFNSLL